jgi:alpha-glucosidase
MIVNKDILFHDGTDNFCKFNKTDNTYNIILRAKKGTVMSAFLCVNGLELPMTVSSDDYWFHYYEATLDGSEKIYRYYFKVNTAEGVRYYNMFEISSNFKEEGYFELTPGFDIPDWAKGAVMYQIMVDRFCNGDRTNDVVDNEYVYIQKGVTAIKDWNQNPSADGTREFYGGDLQGVIDKLDYLQKLGVEVIYFNPLFVSPSNHKYDIQDYDYIDPHFGRIINDGGQTVNDDGSGNQHASKYKIRTTDLENLEAGNRLFIELVEKAHKRGIRIIMDGVFNHCGSFNKWMDREHIYKDNENYNPGAYASKDSPYNSYFRFSNDNWPENDSYEGWWGMDTLPKLNYEGSEALCDYIIDIAKKWVSPPYNIDGWRLDVAADLGHSPEFNHNFWKRFRKNVKEANPEAVILAEHYGDGHEWLKGDEWDTVMNYDAFMDPVTWFLTGVDKHSDNANEKMRGDGETFNSKMKYYMSRMQNKSLLAAMNELSNHDHSRFMTRTNKMVGRVGTAGSKAAEENTDVAIFKQGVIMQMTLPGAPTLYYGDEAGVCGWTDPDDRRTYPWGHENMELLEFYREAISIHRQNKVLRVGSYMPLLFGEDIICYGRFDMENAVITAVNTSKQDKELDIPVYLLGMKEHIWERIIETNRVLYNCGRIPATEENGQLKVIVKAETSVVYKCKTI